MTAHICICIENLVNKVFSSDSIGLQTWTMRFSGTFLEHIAHMGIKMHFLFEP